MLVLVLAAAGSIATTAGPRRTGESAPVITGISPQLFPLGGGDATVCISSAALPPTADRVHCSLVSGDGQVTAAPRYVYPDSTPLNFTASRVLNSSCAVCALPAVVVPGAEQLVLGVSAAPGENISWSSSSPAAPRVVYFDSVEVTFGRRPYITEENGTLLLAPHASLWHLGPFAVMLQLPFAGRNYTWGGLDPTTAEHVLPFSLAGLPAVVNQDCLIVVTFAPPEQIVSGHHGGHQSDACERALHKSGCHGKLAGCTVCASNHQHALKLAGCVDSEIRRLCGSGGLRFERLARFQRAPPLPPNSTLLPVQVCRTGSPLGFCYHPGM